MRQALLFIAIGIVAGIGMATLFDLDPIGTPATERLPSGLPVGGGAGLDERISGLEAALTEERRQRAALETELADLGEQIGALSDMLADGSAATVRSAGATEAETADASSSEVVAARFGGRRGRLSAEDRLNRLIEAGFSTDQAHWILERESQTRMDMLNAQYEARREGEPFNPVEQQMRSEAEIRGQLGDAMYAQYLEATGRPSSVAVREVLESSPAQAAGLQRGDEIVSYAGQRVFNLLELNELTLGGEPGETVAVDILRDGQPMQIYMPRGPLGFAGGGRNFAFGPTVFRP